MKIAESRLRRLIREEILRMADLPVEEKTEGNYYTLRVIHSKTFEFPGRDPITVDDYERSELRARVRDGVMEIVSIYVPENQRGKKLATQMVQRAAAWGAAKGYEVIGSGVYSSQGSALAKSFIDKGLARVDAQYGKHSFTPGGQVGESRLRRPLREVRGSIPTDVMMGVVGRLPDALRKEFPSVGHAVVRGGKEIRPFDLVQQFVKYPPVFSLGEEVRFALHLGDGYRRLLPTDTEIAQVQKFVSDWLRRRGWYVYSSGRQSMGEILTISTLPRENEYVTPGKVMYHLTDRAAVESIKRSGLTPRGSVSRGYPPRVYLFTNVVDLNEQIENNIEAWEPGLSWNDQLTKSPDMVVIEIDPGALRKGTKFEVDPEYSGSTGAVYTKSHIPPEAIVKITPVSGKYEGR